MRKEYDFSAASGAKRAKDVPHLAKLQARAQPNKTRVTMWIDEDVVAAFRARGEGRRGLPDRNESRITRRRHGHAANRRESGGGGHQGGGEGIP